MTTEDGGPILPHDLPEHPTAGPSTLDPDAELGTGGEPFGYDDPAADEPVPAPPDLTDPYDVSAPVFTPDELSHRSRAGAVLTAAALGTAVVAAFAVHYGIGEWVAAGAAGVSAGGGAVWARRRTRRGRGRAAAGGPAGSRFGRRRGGTGRSGRTTARPAAPRTAAARSGPAGPGRRGVPTALGPGRAATGRARARKTGGAAGVAVPAARRMSTGRGNSPARPTGHNGSGTARSVGGGRPGRVGRQGTTAGTHRRTAGAGSLGGLGGAQRHPAAGRTATRGRGRTRGAAAGGYPQPHRRGLRLWQDPYEGMSPKHRKKARQVRRTRIRRRLIAATAPVSLPLIGAGMAGRGLWRAMHPARPLGRAMRRSSKRLRKATRRVRRRVVRASRPARQAAQARARRARHWIRYTAWPGITRRVRRGARRSRQWLRAATRRRTARAWARAAPARARLGALWASLGAQMRLRAPAAWLALAGTFWGHVAQAAARAHTRGRRARLWWARRARRRTPAPSPILPPPWTPPPRPGGGGPRGGGGQPAPPRPSTPAQPASNVIPFRPPARPGPGPARRPRPQPVTVPAAPHRPNGHHRPTTAGGPMHPVIAQLEEALAAVGSYEPHPGALNDCRWLLSSLVEVCDTGGQAFAGLADRFREALPTAAEGGDGIAQFGAAFVALEDHAEDAMAVLVGAHAETFDRIDSGDVSMDTTTNADAVA